MSELAKALRAPASATLVGGLILGSALPAGADEMATNEPPPMPEGDISIQDHIIRWDADEFRHAYDSEEFISRLGLDGESLDGETEEDTIVLETDILFRTNEWDIPQSAVSRIVELVEDIPEGAALDVQGHTDSRPVDETQHDFDNQELSENRAQAVADVLEEERPDLTLNVEGFGSSDPAVTEDEEDPSTFAANRRVEIRAAD